MTLDEFLAQLPPQVMAHLSAYELDKAVAALPKPLFEELTKAVIGRIQAAENANPNAEELATWHKGQRPQAIMALRARTGQSLAVCKQLFDRGLLVNLTAAAFAKDPQP